MHTTRTALISFFFGVFWMIDAQAQGVKIGAGTPPHASATLEVGGTNGGFLLPTMTTAQRNGIGSPAQGLQVYNSDTRCIEAYFQTGWKAISCECSSAPPSPTLIQGPSLVCPSDTAVVFSISPVQGAFSYVWSIGNLDTVVGPNNLDSISVNFSAIQGSRSISVVAVNSCGSSAPTLFSISVANPVSAFSVVPASPIINNAAQFTATTQNSTFSWSFQNGSPGSSTSGTPSVTWTQTGNVLVRLIATSSVGCKDTLDSTLTVINCVPATFSFSNCGQTGTNGPTQAQCNASYGLGVVSVNSGVQTWTVPATGNYTITTAGGQGGIPNGVGQNNRGSGGIVRATFALTSGTQLNLVVGQEANQNTQGNTANGGGNGGGGSFVWVSGQNLPLLVGGGGGGGSIINGGSAQFHPGKPGNLSPDGSMAWNNDPVHGTNGNSASAGGKGWNAMVVNGFTGIAGNGYGQLGGFGGGGPDKAGGDHAGGGGGGYSGGGGAWMWNNTGSGNSDGRNGGGGGGSYIHSSGTNPATSTGQFANSGTFNGSPIQNIGQYNAGQGYITIVRTCP
jgi:hypothetical protein